MGQRRQRDGDPRAGDLVFAKEIVALPAEDPRAVGVLASRGVAVLRPVVLGVVSAAAGDMDLAWRALWDEQQAGRSSSPGNCWGSRTPTSGSAQGSWSKML